MLRSFLIKSVLLAVVYLLPVEFVLAQQSLPPWEEGFLDIHHINTGEGNSTFVQMPDGTTLLVDIGTVDKVAFEQRHFPLKATSRVPDSSLSVGARVAWYLQKMSNRVRDSRQLDYLLITHFHSDHFGAVPQLLAELMPKKIIDRDYPSYGFPFDLRTKLKKDTVFQRYMAIVDSGAWNMEKAQVGSSTQLGPVYHPGRYPTFRIQNIKNGASLWSPEGAEVRELFTAEEMATGGYNENPLSMAFKVSYGDFDYYFGADNTGLQDSSVPKWFDVETALAASVGKVDAMVLNHHGNRDANNANFIGTLDPQVAIQQVYSSDQPGQEVFYRLQNLGRGRARHLYATNMHSETRTTYGPWFDRAYRSMQGHVVLRVYPNGKTFKVYVLDESNLSVKDEQLLHSEN